MRPRITISTRLRSPAAKPTSLRSEVHTSELQSQSNLVCRLLLAKKNFEERLDNMTSCDTHGSVRIYALELGLKLDGSMLAFGLQVIDGYGADFQFSLAHYSIGTV